MDDMEWNAMVSPSTYHDVRLVYPLAVLQF